VRPDEIMSPDNLTCSITNRPFLVYGSLTAYFFPLAVMLVAYTASIRLLGRQGAETRLRWGAAADAGGNWLRRSRSGRQQSTSTVHSGARTPELFTCRYRRDGCASSSAAGSVVGSFRGGDVLQRRSYRDRSLSPLPCADDNPVPATTGWNASSTSAVRTEPIGCRNVTNSEHPLNDSDGAEETRGDDKSDRLISRRIFSDDAATSERRLPGGDGCTRAQNPRDLATSRDLSAPRSLVNAARSAKVDDASPHLVTLTAGQRFRSLVQKHAATILAAGEFLQSRDHHREQSRDRDDDGSRHPPRNHVATAVAAVAAIRTVRTERKAARVIGAVFAVFVACWTPFFVLNLSLGVCGPPCAQAVTGAGSLLYPVFLWLGYVSSTLNPIVYTVFNGTFRRTFVDLLTCRCNSSLQRQPYNATSRTARRRRHNPTV